MRAPWIFNTLTFAGLLQSVYCPINIIFKLSVCQNQRLLLLIQVPYYKFTKQHSSVRNLTQTTAPKKVNKIIDVIFKTGRENFKAEKYMQIV